MIPEIFLEYGGSFTQHAHVCAIKGDPYYIIHGCTCCSKYPFYILIYLPHLRNRVIFSHEVSLLIPGYLSC